MEILRERFYFHQNGMHVIIKKKNFKNTKIRDSRKTTN